MEKTIHTSRFSESVNEIITAMKPYVILHKVDMEIRPQMPYLRHILLTTKE